AATLMLAAWKRAWASVGLVVLALSLGLMVLARLGPLSFSMNAVLAPILFTCLFSLFALWFQTANRHRLALLFALLAGASLGFATLIRLPSFLLAPGFLILLGLSFRDYRNLRIMVLPIVFAAGVTITGVIPVLINQHDVAGAWYHSTYASVDSAPPTLAPLRANLSYFLGHGPASVDNWALIAGLIGFVGFLLLYSRRDSEHFNRLGLSWKRLAFAASVLWIIPICYFLTHWTTASYYMTPAIFAAVTIAGFGALGIEATNNAVQRFEPRKILSWVALLLILWPGVATFQRAWSNRVVSPAPRQASTHPPILLPSELMDDKAWIWADLLTGSLWYYANKPAFKIHVTDDETRAMLFKFVFDRGERQYLIDDGNDIEKHIKQIEQMGGKLELHGKVDGYPYFLIVWPSEGPG
ncbi:MAG TPA: hypothetical protein VJ875_18975, partial [Pyrinomonadaceae bacterium]|nr:hypothetical protein [Pyrinomonadaceae bacterium]